MAQPFDTGSLRLTGESVPIAKNVAVNLGNRRTAFTVSQNGILAFRTGGQTGQTTQLTSYDRSGMKLETIANNNDDITLRLSPDGKTLITSRQESGGTRNLWTLDLTRGGFPTPFTSSEVRNSDPVFSPDGEEVVFLANEQGGRGKLYRKRLNAGGDPEAPARGSFDTFRLARPFPCLYTKGPEDSQRCLGASRHRGRRTAALP